MSEERFLNAMRRQSAQQDAGMGQPRWAVVESVDSQNHLARVTLQPEGVLTGWLPILTQTAGAGWGVLSSPVPGQQVFVLPDNGDAQHGVIVGMGHSTQAMPPKVASGREGSDGHTPTVLQPGETALVHQSGSVIRLNNDGTIFSQGTWNHQGDLHVSGDIWDKNDALGTLDRLRTAHNTHHHDGVKAGSDKTALPDVTAP